MGSPVHVSVVVVYLVMEDNQQKVLYISLLNPSMVVRQYMDNTYVATQHSLWAWWTISTIETVQTSCKFMVKKLPFLGICIHLR